MQTNFFLSGKSENHFHHGDDYRHDKHQNQHDDQADSDYAQVTPDTKFVALDRPEELADLRNTVSFHRDCHNHHDHCRHVIIIINIVDTVIIMIIVIIFNQVHYMYFALGAYGWPMYLLQNKSVTVSFLLIIITLAQCICQFYDDDYDVRGALLPGAYFI